MGMVAERALLLEPSVYRATPPHHGRAGQCEGDGFVQRTCAARSSASRCAVASIASSSSRRSVTARRVFASASCNAAAARRSASCRPAASASSCMREVANVNFTLMIACPW